MQFSHDFTIPASTPQATPYTEAIRLDTGVLTAVQINFRPGCHNRVYVAIYDALRQIIPAHETPALYGDDFTFDIPMAYDLSHKPYELLIKGWSPDTRYNHTLSMHFYIVETAQEKKSTGLNSLIHLLGGR